MSAETTGRIDGRKYRALAARFRRDCERDNKPCHLCGQPINYELTRADDRERCFEVDHAVPRSVAPELTVEYSNLRASHALCNLARSNNAIVGGIGVPSRAWLKPDA